MKTILQHNGFTASILSKGAELISFQNPDQKEFIWNGDSKFWNRHSPVLFPIVGSLKNNSYEYKGNGYSLPRHGFARDMVFRKTHESENKVVFELDSDDQTLIKYPFDFSLKISYKLENNDLHIGYSILNHNDRKMYFGIGAHPAFQLAHPIEEYTLEFPKADVLEYNTLVDGLLSQEKKQLELHHTQLQLNYNLFNNDALVFVNNPHRLVHLKHLGKTQVVVEFDDFPHLSLWTVPNASFLCIEPWHSYTDLIDSNGDISQKKSIQVLEPQGVFNTNFRISIF